MKENWKDAVGYEGLYEVSDQGRVRSKIQNTRIVDKQDFVMREKFDGRGYLRVNLHKDGKCKAELVSRLVANAFIPNPSKLPHVGHNDDVKTNNRANNLYWTNPAENNRHNGKLDRFHDAHRENISVIADKLSTKIRGVSLDGSQEMTFNSLQEAARSGNFDEGKISMCINGKRGKHKGYRWERI